VGGIVNIEVSDNQLFEIIGRKEVELYSANKELDAYRVSLETTKGLATEVTALRAGKPALELSNKQLAEKNIQLDQALTEARKEREAIRVKLTQRSSALTEAQIALKNATDSQTDLQFRFNELQASIPQKKPKK
jgi:chromosome segregation ATPase